MRPLPPEQEASGIHFVDRERDWEDVLLESLIVGCPVALFLIFLDSFLLHDCLFVVWWPF